MIQLILGRSGYGKSQKILAKINEIVKDGQKPLIIVPDQFSFEMERILYFYLGAEKSINVEVLGFSRLAHIIFREYGGLAGRYISDGGKNLLVHMAIEEVFDDLDLYKKSALNPSFIKEITATISELKQSSVNPEDLYKASLKIFTESSSKKTQEISLIYDAYNALLKRGYEDTDDDLTKALELARKNNFFLGKTVFIDEFKGFTADEFNIINEMVQKCKNLFIGLCCDDIVDFKDGLELFSYVKKSTMKLMKFAKEGSIAIDNTIILKEPKRYNKAELVHMEKNLFDLKKTSEYFENSSIKIFKADDIYQEIEFVCAKIKKMVQEKGLRYKEFAILGRDIDTYENAISTHMNRYKIPYFSSTVENVYSKPYMMFVTSFIKAATENYDNNAIFSCLKAGLTSISTKEIAMLENYVYVWDIKGILWESEFINNPRGFVEVIEDDKKDLEKINEIRKNIIDFIKLFRKKTKENITGLQFSKILYETIEVMNIPENYTKILENLKTEESRSEYKQVFDVFAKTLDEFANALKNTYLPAKKHVELLNIMIESMEVGEIPQYLDEVLVGDASLVRANNPKYTFIIGANEKIFPKAYESSGIFTDEERKKLVDFDIHISDDIESKIIDETFIVYKALTSASDGVYISYPLYGPKGEPMSASAFIEELKEVSGGIVEIDRRYFENDLVVQNEQSALYSLGRNYNLDNTQRATLINLLNSEEIYKANLDYLEEVVEKKDYSIDDKDLSKRLYGNHLILSPTRVEKFMNCKFAYFAQYGLRLRKIEKAKLSPLEIGSLVHYVLQVLLQKYGDELINQSRKTIKADIEDILNAYIEEFMGGADDKTTRFKYLYTRLTNTLLKLIEQLKKEFSQSLFRPVDFEMEVKKGENVEPLELLLPDGGRIRVEGIIDRIDIMKKGEQKYIRIVDYKTGHKDFKLSDVYHGLNIQMLVYLFSIWKNGKGKYKDVLPAGVLYMPAISSAIDADRNADEEEMKEKQSKKYRMQGLVLNDVDIIKGMDKEAKGIFINVPLNKNGGPKKSATVATLAELGNIEAHIEKLLINMGKELHEGKVQVNPIKETQRTSCDYCSYRVICGQESNDEFRTLEKITHEETLKKIKEDKENE